MPTKTTTRAKAPKAASKSTKKSAKAPAKNTKSTRETAIAETPLWFKVAGGFVAAFVAFVVLFLALLFSSPDRIPAEMPQLTDYVVQSKLISKVMKECSREPLNAEAKLRFKPEEFAALMRIADTMKLLSWCGVKSDYPLRYYRLQLHDRAVKFVFPMDTKMRWLFGGVIHFKGEVEPEKDGQELFLHFRSLKMGAFTLPGFLVDHLAKQQLDKFCHSKNFKQFDQVVKSVFFARGSKKLTVIYRPPAVTGFFH